MTLDAVSPFPYEGVPGAALVYAVDEALHGPLLHGGRYRALTLRCPCQTCYERRHVRSEYGIARAGKRHVMPNEHRA